MLDNSERNEDEMKNSVTQLENSGEKRRGRMAYVEDTFFFSWVVYHINKEYAN